MLYDERLKSVISGRWSWSSTDETPSINDGAIPHRNLYFFCFVTFFDLVLIKVAEYLIFCFPFIRIKDKNIFLNWKASSKIFTNRLISAFCFFSSLIPSVLYAGNIICVAHSLRSWSVVMSEQWASTWNNAEFSGVIIKSW